MRLNPEYEQFNAAMNAILKVKPETVKAAMQADKQQRAEQRKAKKPSASARASRAKD